MAIFLKKFETTAAYNAAKPNLILPNVSLITENNKVEYNPYVPPIIDGHEYVEIGGIKWATMNIGANSVTDTGLYFQWGDASGYTSSQVGTDKTFNWAGYKYTDGGSLTITKYNTTDGETVLEASDDAVTAAWGSGWRMPTKDEFGALTSATTSAWTADYNGSGVSGLVLTDKTDNTKEIFFPAAGGAWDDIVGDVGSEGSYWSSRVYSGNIQYAYALTFGRNYVRWNYSYYRDGGRSVRGVVSDN